MTLVGPLPVPLDGLAAMPSPGATDAGVDPAAAGRVGRAWAVLDQVPDPEVPAISLCQLGIVREVQENGDVLEVVLTPTYSGCPATEVIASSAEQALVAAGLGPVQVRHRLAPAWTTDWITPLGRERLRRYGIAPPQSSSVLPQGVSTVRWWPQATRPAPERPAGVATAIACPRCDSVRTEQLSAFGSTACKSLYRCLACREPFEYFKPL